MGSLHQLTQMVVPHGMNRYCSSCQGTNREQNNIDTYSPKETEPPQIEAHHESKQSGNKYNVSPAYHLSYMTLNADSSLELLIGIEHLIAVNAPSAFSLINRQPVHH